MTPLSVLDLSPVVSGQTAADALRNTIDLARHAERLGYHRYWVAEHHLVPGVASTSPSVLIALIASATREIRVGSGAVLLGYHPPLAVAEQFGTIAQLHPRRIDVGLGRSGFIRAEDRVKSPAGAPAEAKVVDGLLIPGRPRLPFDRPDFFARHRTQQQLLGLRDEPVGDYADQVRTILDFVDGEYRDSHGESYRSPTAEADDLEVWVLGSSAGPSAQAAAKLGLPFTANYHVSPSTVLEATTAYRESFQPSARLGRPHVMVSADVVVAEDEAKARELAGPYAQWVLSIRDGRGAIPFPSTTEAAAFDWTTDQRALIADRIDTQFVGTPATVVEQLKTLRDVTGAHELLITTITHDHADRVRSHELLARAWSGV
ncbi:MAG TPA: LLM class flavin-dependent oxidoreductase [Amycolatopsis sp.]|nr:LLM class flavin-dependent oxidoreductase [Amycolatopsis sp.]